MQTGGRAMTGARGGRGAASRACSRAARRAVGVLLAAAVSGLAGCSASGGNGGGDPTDGASAGDDVFTSRATGWNNGEIVLADGTRVFRYYLPSGFDCSAPLVMLLHGGRQGMDTIFSSGSE